MLNIQDVLEKMRDFGIHNPDIDRPVGIGTYESGQWYISFRNSSPHTRHATLNEAISWLNDWIIEHTHP